MLFILVSLLFVFIKALFQQPLQGLQLPRGQGCDQFRSCGASVVQQMSAFPQQLYGTGAFIASATLMFMSMA